MAGHCAILNGLPVFVDYADGIGSAVVDGRLWQWEHHEWCGPLWLRKDGYTPRKCQNPTSRKVWSAYERWLRKQK